MKQKGLEIFTKDNFSVKAREVNGQVEFEIDGIAKSLGLSRTKNNKKYIMWDRINQYLADIKFPQKCGSGDFISEQYVYLLAMKTKNDVAIAFQEWLAFDVLPSIRKHGAYMTDEKIEEILLNPDTIIKLATQLKEEKEKRKIAEKKNTQLVEENKVLVSDVLEWANTATINALVRKYAGSLGNDFRSAWIEFKKNLLYKHGINLNSRMTAYLNNSGKKTKPATLSLLHGKEELTNALKTAIALCKDNNIEVYEILHKHSKDIKLDD